MLPPCGAPAAAHHYVSHCAVLCGERVVHGKQPLAPPCDLRCCRQLQQAVASKEAALGELRLRLADLESSHAGAPASSACASACLTTRLASRLGHLGCYINQPCVSLLILPPCHPPCADEVFQLKQALGYYEELCYAHEEQQQQQHVAAAPRAVGHYAAPAAALEPAPLGQAAPALAALEPHPRASMQLQQSREYAARAPSPAATTISCEKVGH